MTGTASAAAGRILPSSQRKATRGSAVAANPTTTSTIKRPRTSASACVPRSRTLMPKKMAATTRMSSSAVKLKFVSKVQQSSPHILAITRSHDRCLIFNLKRLLRNRAGMMSRPYFTSATELCQQRPVLFGVGWLQTDDPLDRRTGILIQPRFKLYLAQRVKLRDSILAAIGLLVNGSQASPQRHLLGIRVDQLLKGGQDLIAAPLLSK